MTTTTSIQQAARIRQAAINERASAQLFAEILSFAVGFGISIAYLPTAIFDLQSRAATVWHIVPLTAPLVATLIFLPKLKRGGTQDNALSRLTRAWVLAFLFSTALSLLIDSHDKILTILGSCTALIISYAAISRLVPYRAIVPFLSGIQIGFIIFAFYMLFAGKVHVAQIGVGLTSQIFSETEDVHRNAVTMLALNSLAASLSSLVLRRRRSQRIENRVLSFAIEATAVGVALYLIYIVPGKGAWVSAGILFSTYVFLLVMSRRWMLIGWIFGVGVLLTPIIYARISSYVLVYSLSAASVGFSSRFILWQLAWDHIRERSAYIFGFGYESAFEVSGRLLGENLFHFHNEFVNALYDGGVVGTALLVAAVFTSVRYAIRQSGPALRSGDRAPLYSLFLLALILSRVMTDVSLTSYTELVPAWLYCCGLLSLSQRPAYVRRETRSTSPIGNIGQEGLGTASVRPRFRVGALPS